MADLLSISSELSEAYLSQCLSRWFQKDVAYTKHEFSEMASSGDSYLSDMYRLQIHGSICKPEANQDSNVSVKVLIKAFPKNIARRKTFRCSTFFYNEINFYEKILPTLLKFQSEKNVDNPFVSFPKLFGSISKEDDVFLILEDLSVFGYRSAVRQEGIDYTHCQKILETFPQFHALSFAFKDQHPTEYEQLAVYVPEVYYDAKYWDWYRDFWKLICACAIDATEKEYPNSIYVDKIKDFASEKTFSKLIKGSQANTKSAVFSHGDSWTPNFLFKYKEGTNVPTDIMMIDFQLARSGSPVIDIAFFIYAVTTEELRDKHYKDMLKYYYDTLVVQIKKLGTDPESVYPWDDFMREIKEFSFVGLGFSLESTPVVILPPEEAFDVNSLTGTEPINMADIMKIKPIKSKEGRQRLSGLIKHAVDNGFI